MEEVNNNSASLVTEDFIEKIHIFEANRSIGASTARGMGKGTVKSAHGFLRLLDIRTFVTTSEMVFQNQLNRETEKFRKILPNGSWGAARKFLNIFLRGAVYNRYLEKFHGLSVIEPFLEVPLDSHVAKKLIQDVAGLPDWGTIIRLRDVDSQKFQNAANHVAKQRGIARVHLDLWYWRSDKYHVVYHLRNRVGANARGFPTVDGNHFVVMRGSICVENVRISAPHSLPKDRERLITDGIVALEKNSLTFTRDHKFSSPSYAAAFITGVAGKPKHWKSKDGRSMRDIGSASPKNPM